MDKLSTRFPRSTLILVMPTNIMPVTNAPTTSELQSSSSTSCLPKSVKKRRRVPEERQRASRACDGCRRLKEKCEGGCPCYRCAHAGRQCLFTEVSSKADVRRPSSWNHSVDTDIMDELQLRTKYLERIVKYYLPSLSMTTADLGTKAAMLEADHQSRIQHASDSAPDTEDEINLDEEKHTINAVDATVTHYSGEFSYWNFSMKVRQHVEELLNDANVLDVRDSNEISHCWRVGELHTNSTQLRKVWRSLPPLRIAKFLTFVFFKHAAINYFYVDQIWTTDKLQSLYENPSALTSKDTSALAIVVTILAIGSQYAYLEAQDEAPREDSAGNNQDVETGRVFYSQAITLLPEILHIASLESVQACLLFGLYALPIDASGLAYIYLNLALKLAVQNGLHKRISDHVFPAHMAETRKRVWWTIYCTERRIGIFHGRPTSVLATDVDVEIPCDTESPEREAGAVMPLIVSIKIVKFLEEFYVELQKLRGCMRPELSGILDQLLTIRENFQRWWSTVPKGPAWSGSLQSASYSARSPIHIQLEYYLVLMFVGRPFLLGQGSSTRGLSATRRHVRSPDLAGADETSPATSHSTRTSRTQQLIGDCIEAALKVIDICESLEYRCNGSAQASYTEYSACRASLLVLLAFCIQNHTDRYYRPLRKGLNVIRKYSTSGDSAKNEVLLIESLERAVHRLPFFGSHTEPGPSESQQTTATYDLFQQWSSGQKSDEQTVENGANLDTALYLSGKGQPQWINRPMDQDGEGQLSTKTQPPFRNSLRSSYDSLNPSSLDELQHFAGSAFFGMNVMENAGGYTSHPEQQLLDNFLAMPEADFY